MEETRNLFQAQYKSFGSLWKRGIALIADGFVLSIPAMLVFIIFFSITGHSKDVAQHSLPLLVSWILFQFIIPIIYFTYTVGKYGMSLGKRALNLKIVNDDGSDINFIKAFLRYAFFFLYSIPYLGVALFVISVLLVIFDKKKQSLHDKLCKTIVLYKQ